MQTYNCMRAYSGFSLVELSIVLVILGLLTGGILSGQALIRAAELRGVTRDMSRYATAIHTFRDKYFGLPGDITNAVKFWGAAAGGTADGVDATCAALDETSPSTGTETCNGNGDGQIVGSGGYERWRSVQQLANAGLIEGHYTGVVGAGGAFQTVPGENAMASRIGNGAYLMLWLGDRIGQVSYYDGSYGNSIFFGNVTDGSPGLPIISPEDAWNVDSKLDDGRPALGKLRTFPPAHAWGTNCADSDVESDANYNVSYSGAACQFLFIQQ